MTDPTPMTYAELFALVGARLPATSPFSIQVMTWLWRGGQFEAQPETEWRITWWAPHAEQGKRAMNAVTGATARDALQQLYSALPFVDATGVGGQVGDASLERPAPMSTLELVRRMQAHGADPVTLEHARSHVAILDDGERYEGATIDDAFAAWCAAKGYKP